jgi:DNA-binding HxlR family transcriptional regulator
MLNFDQLDKTIHEKGRLSIMTLLAGRRSWGFQDLKAELGMSDGNLITHLRKLTEAGYVSEEKDAEHHRPRTTYALTSAGKAAFRQYIDVLEAIVQHTRRP